MKKTPFAPRRRCKSSPHPCMVLVLREFAPCPETKHSDFILCSYLRDGALAYIPSIFVATLEHDAPPSSGQSLRAAADPRHHRLRRHSVGVPRGRFLGRDLGHIVCALAPPAARSHARAPNAGSAVHAGTVPDRRHLAAGGGPALPAWAVNLLDGLHLTSVGQWQQRLSAVAVQASQFLATQALNIGQNTLEFIVSFGVMLYLLFFLLRDGPRLALRIGQATPLEPNHKQPLIRNFTTVIRATVKGNIVVAAAQGALGGLIFWVLGIQGPVLWGVLMAFLSLLPAVGAGLIWVPVAIYFLATGALWQGVVLTAFGVGVIGLVDNILRP